MHARVRGPAAERLLGIFLWRLIASTHWLPGYVPHPEAIKETLGDLSPGSEDRVLEEMKGRTRVMYKRWETYKKRGDAQPRSTSPVRVKIGQTIGNPQIEAAGFGTH